MRFFLTIALLCFLPFAVIAQDTDRPNILFIAIDDMNDWISPLDGHPQTITPNMERLAERGLLFTNAHAPAAVCNATRTAFLSGLRTSTTGIYFNQNDWESNDAATSVRMLPGYFMDAGYRTVGTGKIFHTGHNDPTSWHDYYPAIDRERPDEITPRGDLPINGNYFGGSTFDWGPIVAEDSSTTDGQIAEWMVRHLNQPGDAPRFDAIGFRRPHQPWFVPEKYFDMHPLEDIQLPPIVENDLNDVPDAALRGNFVTEGASINGQTNRQLHEWVLASGQWPNAVQGNLASISFVDAMLGRVLDGLDASGRADNTIIVVFGDHGFHVGEKSSYAKKTLWRESTRVAMFIVAPGVTQPGSRTDAPVNLLDIYPTLTELAGLPTPDHVEGTSLVPLLEDPDADWDRPTVTTNGFSNHSVTGHRYQYIRWSDGSEELYDFIEDPHEFENLAGQPDMTSVKAGLAQWLPEQNAPDVPRARRR
ncbi:MAG: sulfatase [Candidatus Rariloculaceae bacterium]